MDVFVLLVAYRIEVPFLQALLVCSAQQVLQSQWPVSVIQQLSHDFHHQQTEIKSNEQIIDLLKNKIKKSKISYEITYDSINRK